MRRARIRHRRIYVDIWILRRSIAPLSVDLTSSRSLRKVTPGSLDSHVGCRSGSGTRIPEVATTHRSHVAKNRYRTHRAASRWSMDPSGLGKKKERKVHVLGLKRPWTGSWRTTKDQHSVYTGIDNTWRTHLTYDPICMCDVTNMST